MAFTFTGIRSWLAGKVAGKAYSLAELATRFAQARDEQDDITAGVDTSQPFAQCVWVYAAVNLIARNVARLPVAIVDQKNNVIKDSRLGAFVIRPNRHQSWRQFVEYSMVTELLDGHLMWEMVNPTIDGVEQVVPWSVDKFSPDTYENEYGEQAVRTWRRKRNNQPLIPMMDVYEWSLPNPYSSIYGLAPLLAAQLSIYGDVATGVYNRSFFRNGGMPGVVFTSDHPGFDQDKADAAAQKWTEKHGGAFKAHKPEFMGYGLRPSIIGYAPKDMDFASLKQLSKSEILAIYHVPETLLGAMKPTAGVTIGGSERRPDEENFMLNTVMPWAEQLKDFFNYRIARRFGNNKIRFEYKQVPILQDRHLDRAKEGREWIKSGATFNEINRIFDLGYGEHPWGDDYWVPTNMVPARLQMHGPVSANPKAGPDN